MRNKRTGFTLLELMVIIAIIGMLAAMIFPMLGKARTRARKAKVIAELKTIEIALMDYYTEYSSFPTNLNMDPPKTNGLNKLAPPLALSGHEYLDTPLIDPFSNNDEVYKYYACTDNISGGKGTEDVADSCLVFSLGPDREDNGKGNFNDAYADAYVGESEPGSDNIYLILPVEDIRYKK